IANGMPLSVLTGRKDIMNLIGNSVFFFNTFGGEALSLAAAKATITEMKEKNVIEHIYSLGEKLKIGVENIFQNNKVSFASIVGYPFRTLITFNNLFEEPLIIKSYVQQELIKRGILWGGYHNMSFSHTEEDVNYTLSVYDEVFCNLAKIINHDNLEKHLRGIPIQPLSLIRKTSNFNTKPIAK
ncbi:MAG: aminotransferase class III-fold pyridoxal phosphate-dependent enzyme, partial [Ignavibacteriales bacterium]|nr:aminotransferase class III-fold pyridoxal phosphate-dependent enzyme [Ignavibacteriales bacterium]